MGQYRDLVRMAMDKGAGEEAWDLTDDLMERLRKKYPDIYQSFAENLECLAYKISQPEAEKIVKSMRPRGQCYSVQQVRDMLRSKGIDNHLTEWYLVINMCYNDYYDTAKMFGLQNDDEFFFSLAKDFIEDPDAKPHKVQKYFAE